MTTITSKILAVGFLAAGVLLVAMDPALANPNNPVGGTNFNSIANNITNSISNLPGLLSGVAYMFGILIGVLGILKIKDHVENPGQVPLKDGAIRLAAGGGLFALPIVYEAMRSTISGGNNGSGVTAATLSKVTMGING